MTRLLALLLCVAACGDKQPPAEPAEPAAPAEPAEGVTIRIAADGSVAIMDVPATPEDVELALLAVSRELGEQGCVLEVNDAVPYARTLSIVDRCMAAGVKRVSVNGVPIEVPEAAAAPVREAVFYVVSIPKDGSLMVGDKPTPDAELDALLRELVGRPNTDVIVHPDTTVATGRVVDVWKRALAAGVPVIHIVRIKPEVEKPIPKKRPVTEE